MSSCVIYVIRLQFCSSQWLLLKIYVEELQRQLRLLVHSPNGSNNQDLAKSARILMDLWVAGAQAQESAASLPSCARKQLN